MERRNNTNMINSCSSVIKKCLLWTVLLIGVIAPITMTMNVQATNGEETITYGDFILSGSYSATHWDDIWDIAQGDLTLSYTIDMSNIRQPPCDLPAGQCPWTDQNYKNWYTPYVEVGMRGEGSSDFNPGPFGIYQGRCGGWMVSESDDYLGEWDSETNTLIDDHPDTQDGDDKHGLQASGGRDERDYDVLDSNWDTVLSPFGSYNNFGLWFDRDGVGPYQADNWGNLGPGGIGSGDGLRYNTSGIYDIVIVYHAIDVDNDGDAGNDGLGVMFATVNGYPQGFYTIWVSGPPQNYPAGLSFKGDMQHMQVFAGWWYGYPAGWDYGTVELRDISVTGYRGTSDPLVADFTYSPPLIFPGDTIQFTDTTHGGMAPYTYSWDFNNDGTLDSTLQNPTWSYSTPGTYTVKLTVTPFRCVPRTVTKDIIVRYDGSISDYVWLDENNDGIQDGDEVGVEGVTVRLYSGGTLLGETVTDPTGLYIFDNLSAGTYIIQFMAPQGFAFTSPRQGGDTTADSDPGANGRTPPIILGIDENNPTIDAGLTRNGSPPPSQQVPAMTPLGLLGLIGVIALLGVVSLRKKHA